MSTDALSELAYAAALRALDVQERGVEQLRARAGMLLAASSITASFPTLTLPVSVTIGGTNAMVLYAGSAPTLESGYFQFNVALPSGLQASSAVNLVVKVGGSSSVAVPISIQ